jgi:hypothetical protein
MNKEYSVTLHEPDGNIYQHATYFATIADARTYGESMLAHDSYFRSYAIYQRIETVNREPTQ